MPARLESIDNGTRDQVGGGPEPAQLAAFQTIVSLMLLWLQLQQQQFLLHLLFCGFVQLLPQAGGKW